MTRHASETTDVAAIKVSADGSRVVSGEHSDIGGAVRIWNPLDGRVDAELGQGIAAFALSPTEPGSPWHTATHRHARESRLRISGRAGLLFTSRRRERMSGSS